MKICPKNSFRRTASRAASALQLATTRWQVARQCCSLCDAHVVTKASESLSGERGGTASFRPRSAIGDELIGPSVRSSRSLWVKKARRPFCIRLLRLQGSQAGAPAWEEGGAAKQVSRCACAAANASQLATTRSRPISKVAYTPQLWKNTALSSCRIQKPSP